MKNFAATVIILWAALVSAAFAPFFTPAINVVSGSPTVGMQSVFFGAYTGGPFNVSSRYSIFGTSRSTNNTNTPVPTSGVIDKINLMFSSNLSGAGVSITLYKNDVATALSCTVTLGSSACSDNVNSVSVAQGDLIRYMTAPVGGTPTGATQFAYAIRFTSDNPNESIIGSAGTVNFTNSIRYLGFGYNSYPTATTYNDAYQIMPTSGTIDRLYATASSLLSGQTATYTLYKNGSPTGLTCTTTFANNNQCNDVSNSVSFVAGDTLAVSMIAGGAYTGPPAFTARWRPSSPKEFLVFSLSRSLNLSSVNYGGPNNGGTGVTSETPQPVLVDLTWKTMYARAVTAPGGSASWQNKARKNSTDAALSCVISGSSTECSDLSNSVSYTTSDTISLSLTPSTTPTQSVLSISSVMTIP